MSVSWVVCGCGASRVRRFDRRHDALIYSYELQRQGIWSTVYMEQS